MIEPANSLLAHFLVLLLIIVYAFAGMRACAAPPPMAQSKPWDVVFTPIASTPGE